MKNLANTGARRLTTLVILVLPVCLLPACERQGGQAEPWDDTDGFVPAGVSRLPEGLQEKVRSLNEQLKEVPHNGEPLGRLGAIYFVNGFPEMAAKCFGRARELEPRSKHWCYYAGLAYEQLGRQADAAKAYERALQLDPDYASFYVKLADVLVASDRRRAVSLYEQALELNPKDTRAIYGLGLCAEAEGDPEAALARFREALQIIPNYKGAHAAMARVLTSLKRAPEAATHEAAARSGKTPVLDDLLFESLLRSGYSLEMLLHDALFLAEQRLFSQADKALVMARVVDEEGTATRHTAGRVYVMQGRLEEAVQEFRAALEARPDALDIKAELADVLGRLGNHAEAEAAFRAVLEVDAGNRYALERYTQLLISLGRAAEAEKLLWAAAARQPAAPWIRLQLGSLLFEMNKDDEAREQFEACLKLVPDHSQALYFLGLLARRANDLESARKHWQRIIETAPKSGEAYAALAESALHESDIAQAERYLRQGLEQVPDAPGLANALAWILATAPNDVQRNGNEAVQLAERACDSTQRREHEFLDTLAAAYAEVQRFEEAVQTAREAIQLAEQLGNEEAVGTYRQRLELYEQKQPYRQAE